MPINAISIEKIDNKYIINYDGANFVQKKIIVDPSDNIKYVPNMIKQFFKGETNINYKIINYIIYKLYKNINDVNDKLKENEKALKEIYEKSSNMTYNSTRRSKYNDLKYKAERILSILGTTEIVTHDHYEYETSSKNTYYKDFGLNIINMGPYDNNPGSLYIYYDNKIVLEPDSYKEGRWIEILDEIYNNKYKLSNETTSKNKDLETIMDSINKFDNGNWLNDFKNGVNKGINNIENKKQDDYNSMIDKRLSLIKK